jgi:hypothetical protein
MVVHTCTLSIWEIEAGELRVQGQPRLHSKFLGYIEKHCVKKVKKKRTHTSNSGWQLQLGPLIAGYLVVK